MELDTIGLAICPYLFSADTVLGLAREYLYSIEKKYNAKISDRFFRGGFV